MPPANLTSSTFHAVSWVLVSLGVVCAALVIWDMSHRAGQPMAVMRYVWPINALWGSVLVLWAYWTIGRMPSRATSVGAMAAQTPKHRSHPFWKKVIPATLHCGAGCSLADLIGPFVFMAMPFSVFGSEVFGEWTLDYILALAVGVTFQYAALAPMLQQHGLPVWWRALKVDFLSLSAWQVGMYGWMALVIFLWFGRLKPNHIEFWFMMQIAMACGFLTSYPMNWWLIREGVKTAM